MSGNFLTSPNHKGPVSEKIKKKLQKIPFLTQTGKKWSFLEVIFYFFRNHTLLTPGVFFVAFRASRRFF